MGYNYRAMRIFCFQKMVPKKKISKISKNKKIKKIEDLKII